MRIEGLVAKKPKKEISLTPKEDDDLNIDLTKVCIC